MRNLTIEYNLLNLPKNVKNSTGGSLEYVYDVFTNFYCGSVIYAANKTVEYVTHSQGMVRLNGSININNEIHTLLNDAYNIQNTLVHELKHMKKCILISLLLILVSCKEYKIVNLTNVTQLKIVDYNDSIEFCLKKIVLNNVDTNTGFLFFKKSLDIEGSPNITLHILIKNNTASNIHKIDNYKVIGLYKNDTIRFYSLIEEIAPKQNVIITKTSFPLDEIIDYDYKHDNTFSVLNVIENTEFYYLYKNRLFPLVNKDTEIVSINSIR